MNKKLIFIFLFILIIVALIAKKLTHSGATAAAQPQIKNSIPLQDVPPPSK